MIILKGPAPLEFLKNFITQSMTIGVQVEEPIDELNSAKKQRDEALAVLQSEYAISNPNSAQQLAAYAVRANDPVLLSIVRDNGTGKISFAKENLEKLDATDLPFARTLRKYKDAVNIIKAIDTVMKFHNIP